GGGRRGGRPRAPRARPRARARGRGRHPQRLLPARPRSAQVRRLSLLALLRAQRRPERRLSGHDPVVLRDAAIALAREAGAVLREGYGRAHHPERKGRVDLVTQHDRRSERLLLEAPPRRFPGHAVLAEESGAHAGRGRSGTPARGAGGSVPVSEVDTRVRWLIDPLDGTTNFAHNYPFF